MLRNPFLEAQLAPLLSAVAGRAADPGEGVSSGDVLAAVKFVHTWRLHLEGLGLDGEQYLDGNASDLSPSLCTILLRSKSGRANQIAIRSRSDLTRARAQTSSGAPRPALARQRRSPCR